MMMAPPVFGFWGIYMQERSQSFFPKTHCHRWQPKSYTLWSSCHPHILYYTSTPTLTISVSLLVVVVVVQLKKPKKYSNFVWVSSVCLCVDTNNNKQTTNKQTPKNTHTQANIETTQKNVFLLVPFCRAHRKTKGQQSNVYSCVDISFFFLFLLYYYYYHIYPISCWQQINYNYSLH